MEMEETAIAREFISLHKESDIDMWVAGDRQARQLDCEGRLLWIYHNLINGVYGEVRDEGDCGRQIEIGAHESKSGNAQIFYI